MLRKLFFIFTVLTFALNLSAQSYFSEEELKDLQSRWQEAESLMTKLETQTITIPEEKRLRYHNVVLKSKMRFINTAIETVKENISASKRRVDYLEDREKTLLWNAKKNKDELAQVAREKDDLKEEMKGLEYQEEQFGGAFAKIDSVTTGYREFFTSQKSVAVLDQLYLLDRELELYRCKEMVRQLGSYAGFHAGKEGYFARLSDNSKNLQISDVEKNHLTVIASYFLPSFEAPESIDKMKADFYIYDDEGEIVVYTNFVLRPIKALTDIPEGMRYMLHDFIEDGQVFFGDYTIWGNIIKERNLTPGKYTYEIIVNNELTDYCTFSLE